MSFGKTLGCTFCQTSVKLEIVNFPEDLYDLITKYKMDQLFWCCSDCTQKKDSFIHILDMAKKQDLMLQELQTLSQTVHNIQMKFNEQNQFVASSSLVDNHPYMENGFSDSFSSSGSVHSERLADETTASLPVLLDILTHSVKINGEEQTRSKQIVTIFLDKLTGKLKNQNQTFNEIYSHTFYTGSSYEGLRVASANEYDVNLVLKLPFKSNEMEIEYLEQEMAGFAKYKLKNVSADHATIKKRFFRENYLTTDLIKNWMHSMINVAIKDEDLRDSNVIKISSVENGPARTVKLHLKGDFVIDLDLVPVLKVMEWPCGADNSSLSLFSVPLEDQFHFLVPKGVTSSKSMTMSPAENQRMWRIHFPRVEKHILHNLGCVKSIIKLLKLVRDKENWKFLASYYLKTIVMWCVKKNPTPDYWKNDKMDKRFLEVLDCLEDNLKKNHIPSFFYPTLNLICVTTEDAQNKKCRLNRIINDLNRDFSSIRKYVNRPT